MEYNQTTKRKRGMYLASVCPSTYFYYKTPFGPITIAERCERINRISLAQNPMDGEFIASETSNLCATQLLEYFSGKRSVFDIPCSVEGSLFQKRVWSEISNIPYGQTRTAAQIADLLGNPKAFRLVGKAVKLNPLAVVIPSHRVVSANGYVDRNDAYSMLMGALRELEKRNS